MQDNRKKRREWLLLLILLLTGICAMFSAAQAASNFSPEWSVVADMDSMINPNASMTARPMGELAPINPDIMTQPGWMDTFLTPSSGGTLIPTSLNAALTDVNITASPLVTATLAGSPTSLGTATATLIPTNTPLPTSTIYYPPPLPTNIKKAPPVDTPVPSADLSITNTDGVATYPPGGSLTYTIVASNAGPKDVTGATVQDTFPAQIDTISWTCLAAGGASCSASGNININDSVDLPAGGSVTYTVSVTIKDDATGTLTNTATVSGSLSDPNNANNTASDQDTWQPVADLSITKTDNTTTYAAPSVTYIIVVSNAGPSAVTGATVSDTLPTQIASAIWSCVPSAGASCGGSGAGNISDSVDIPAGGNVTYTVNATIAGGASGVMSNTATVSAAIDPNTANNSDTDSDVDNATLPSCDVTLDVSGTGTVNLTAGKVNCLRFDTSGNDKKLSLSGHPNMYVRWDGLNENLSGSCAVHERIFVNASEILTEIGINANGSNETILYVIAEKNGNIDLDLIDSWGGCP